MTNEAKMLRESIENQRRHERLRRRGKSAAMMGQAKKEPDSFEGRALTRGEQFVWLNGYSEGEVARGRSRKQAPRRKNRPRVGEDKRRKFERPVAVDVVGADGLDDLLESYEAAGGAELYDLLDDLLRGKLDADRAGGIFLRYA